MEVCQGVCALCPQPDCNSNKCHMVDSQQSMLTTSSQRSSCSDSLLHDSGDYQWCLDYGYNREYHSKKQPQGILSYHQNEISAYDDISKNIDANLAEIDMETFRSEDIHSILALPTIFSGDFENGHGEKCASVSGSLTGGLDLDSSVSPQSTSEDGSAAEMSICKDEPLFSPLKEQNLPVGTISTDSLDCSSFEEHDLVLTCRANKNNYTIAFEGSNIQFSDDSDYLEAEPSSEGEGCLFHDRGFRSKSGRSMIQSDLGFTTWSKLRRVKDTGKNSAGKSQSLPNLLRQSVEQSSWDHCLPVYDVQKSQTESTDSPVSLLKLFIQHKQSSSVSMSSSQSDSSGYRVNSCNNIRTSDLSEISCNSVDVDSDENDVNIAFLYQNKFTDNEANNNVQKPLDNNNVETITESDEDNSQYFEDSLVETRTTSSKAVYASPIKEEEEPLETDTSSSDETMRDSKDPFESETSEEATLTKNKNQKCNYSVSESNHQCIDDIQQDMSRVNLSQGTQTKSASDSYPCKGKGPVEYISVNFSDKEVQGDEAGSSAFPPATLSRTNSTSSSCSSRKINVSIATTRTCGTQIPVHIKDQEAQTMSKEDRRDSWSFTLKDDGQELPSNEEKYNQQDRKSIYVCYPNYSLPDLSFLRKMTASPENGERVILKPTRHRLPDKQPARRRSYSSEGKGRPRSCGDTVTGQNFSHIRDWDSLSTLLPAEYRSLISQLRRNQPSKTVVSEKCSCENIASPASSSCSLSLSSTKKPSADPAPPPIPERSMSLPVSEPSRRSILRKSSSATHCTTGHGSMCTPQKCQSSPMMPWTEEAHQKRLSLQEPFQCLLDNIPESALNSDTHNETSVKSVSRHSLAGQCIVGNKASHQLSRAASEGYWGRTCPCSYHQQSSYESDTVAEVHRLLESDPSLHLAAALLSERPLEDSGYDQRCSCSRNKKTVSFCENIDVHFRGHYGFPKAEPYVHAEGCTCPCAFHMCSGRSEVPSSSADEIKPGSIRNSKSIYLQRIKLAVNHILIWFNTTPQNLSTRPPLESLVVSQLCPALYALLADGLLSSVQGLFGPLTNTPWRIAETSCQQRGTNFKELLELVAYVNGEETLKNQIFKFNAFILGLLNLGLLEQWLMCLLSCSRLVQHNYSPTGLLFLTSLPQFVTLREDLLHILHPLTCLTFSLDIRVAASVSPTEFVSACQRYEEDSPRTGRRARPVSCIEVSNNEHPPGIKGSNSWECGGTSFDENLNATPSDHLAVGDAVHVVGPDGSIKYSPATSGDSGCSSQPPDLQDGDSFQQLRQKWEHLATHPPQQEVAASKPPLPNSPYKEVKKVSTPNAHRKQVENSPRTLRSKLPSPVRALDTRPQTPESPARQRNGNQVRSSSPPSSAGRNSRRSFIPVHRPGVRGNSGKRH